MLTEKRKDKVTVNRTARGIIFIVASAASFACMDAAVQLSGNIPVLQKVFFRNLFSLILVSGILLLRRIPLQVSGSARNHLFSRCFFGAVGVIFNFFAIGIMFLPDAIMLNKMSPFFAVVFSAFLLKEKVKPPQILLLFCALGGCFFVLKPSVGGMISSAGFLGLLGGMFAGLAYTEVRVLGIHGVRQPVIIFYFSAFTCLMTTPVILFRFRPMTAEQTLFLILTGITATAGQFFITAAYSCAPAREISVYDYSQILFAAALSFLLFRQIPDRQSIAGYAIMIAAAVTMNIYNRRQESSIHVS